MNEWMEFQDINRMDEEHRADTHYEPDVNGLKKPWLVWDEKKEKWVPIKKAPASKDTEA